MTGSDIEAVRLRAVNRSVDHVLAHLSDPLDLHGLAAMAGYSPWHFQRVFALSMGESPAAFVARARVERAATLARAEPGRPWFDIATEVGYADASQLSRTFRARFGVPARTWDRRSPLLDRADQPGLAELPKVAESTRPVEVARLPAIRLAYLRVLHPYATGNLQRAWEVVADWRRANAASSWLVGMSWDDPASVPVEDCRYDLGVVLAPRAERPDWASERWMPSTWAATIHVDGDLTSVDGAWEYLHRTWLPSSSHRPAALPSIERFHADPRPGWTSWSLDCILPLGERRR